MILCRGYHSFRVLVPRACAVTASNNNRFTTSASINSPKIEIASSLKSLTQSPAPPLALGLAGVIPFCAAPAYMINNGLFCPLLANYHMAYGAVILSFLGGVRWGMAVEGRSILPTWYHFTWSVTPSLIGWSALCMPSVTAGYLTLVGGLGSACYLDLVEAGYPQWFKGLRIVLTTVAITSLLTGLACKFILSQEKSASIEENKDIKT